jgi:hypothetical protein
MIKYISSILDSKGPNSLALKYLIFFAIIVVLILLYKVTKKPAFRLGGFLTKFGDDYKYVVLSNGTISWSVQNNADTQFWSKMNSKEIVTNLETEMEEKTDDKVKKLKEKNEYLIKLIEEQQKESEKLAKKLKEIESVTKKVKK